MKNPFFFARNIKKQKNIKNLSYIKIKNLIKYHNNKADSILPSHKRAAMSVSPVFGNAIAAFCFN